MGSFCSTLCSFSNCCKNSGKKTEENKETNEIPKPEIRKKSENQKVSVNDNSLKIKATDEMRNKKVKKIIIDPISYQMSSISDDNDGENDETVHSLIDQQKLKEVFVESTPDKDSYGRVRFSQKLLSLQHYNELGLIDVKSEEFSDIKNFMHSIGFGVIDSIGSGSYAEVYKAYDRHRKKEMSVKVFDLIETKNKYETSFMPRDVNIVRKLSHKNVIKVYQMIRTENKIFVVMDLAANGSIADWISKRGPLNEFMSRLLFIPILEGLDYMHSKNIAHRNLKLENILLSENLNPKISDFCYAVIVDHKRPMSPTFCGSLPYFSSEIIQYLPHNPFISDIWSLGVCLYIILNDRLPFKSNDIKEMFEKQQISGWKLKKDVETKVSKELKIFIGLMLEMDIILRPTTKQLLKQAWIKKEFSSETL